MMEAIGALSISAEETIARTIHCTVCNAPPHRACQKIEWDQQRTPQCVPRPHHPRRLVDAQRIQRLRRHLREVDNTAYEAFLPSVEDVAGEART